MNQLNTALPNHDEIALCAFLIWEKEGRQPGHEQTYWLQAEAQLRLTRQQKAEAAAKATRTWPPQTATAPKIATARALKPVAPKHARITTASRSAAAKPVIISKSPTRKSVSATPARKAMARS